MLEGSISRGLKSVRNYQINAIAITTTDIPLFTFLPILPISFEFLFTERKKKKEEKFITRKIENRDDNSGVKKNIKNKIGLK